MPIYLHKANETQVLPQELAIESSQFNSIFVKTYSAFL